jgi:beta-lactam-binding protein with PASTA domain
MKNLNLRAIFNMEPYPGTIVEAIDNIKPVIDIFVSKGQPSFNMPSVIGLTKELAEEKLKDFGLSITNIIYEFSDCNPRI